MFLVRAGTVIQVQTPKSMTHFNWGGWIPYTTKEDRYYDTHEVWDYVAVNNDRPMPDWMIRNITEHGYTIISAKGKFAMVRNEWIQYVD